MKTIVVGGGMAGLIYSIQAARHGHDVTLCERNKRVGRKVAMSGNGRCNIGNLHASGRYYNAPEFADEVFRRVPTQKYIEFLQSVGIYTYADEQGRLYPVTDSASSVVDCLRAEAERQGVDILFESDVASIYKDNGEFCVGLNDGALLYCDNVVVACGSKSQAEETGLSDIVDGEYLTALSPSLTPVRVKNMDGTLNGVRNRAKVTLLRDNVAVTEESGEVQFKDYGLSGVCVFNLSAVIARDIVARQRHEYTFVVDVLPDMDEKNIVDIVARRIAEGRNDYLLGLVKNRIAEYVAKRVKNCPSEDIARRVASEVKHMPFIFAKLLDYSMSQVTAGGIDLSRINPETFALPCGVVVLGEALNVDGVCGGFNLQFAASSALACFCN